MCLGLEYYASFCLDGVGEKGKNQGPHLLHPFPPLAFIICLAQPCTSYCVSKLKTNNFNKFVELLGGKGDFYVVHWSEKLSSPWKEK